MSQAEFARRLGIFASRLSLIERDTLSVRVTTYEAIVAALGFRNGRELDAAAQAALAKEARSRRKHCPGCGRDLPVTEFNRSRAGRDGRQGWCRDCTRAATRSWRERNPDSDRRHDRRRRAAYRRDRVQINRDKRSVYAERREAITARRRELYRASRKAQ